MASALLSQAELQIVADRLSPQWSPEQIAGRLRRDGILNISHESIDQYIWADNAAGGDLHRHDHVCSLVSVALQT